MPYRPSHFRSARSRASHRLPCITRSWPRVLGWVCFHLLILGLLAVTAAAQEGAGEPNLHELAAAHTPDGSGAPGAAAPDSAEGPSTGNSAAVDPEGAEPLTPGQVKHGSLLFRTSQPGFYVAAPSLETDVKIEVTGMVARTIVRQRFRNPNQHWVEGIYVFPLPTASAVDAMRLVIGDRIIEGEIQERQQARKTYEAAKRQGKKASLVEQERPNIFTTAVANLGPGEEVDVVIEYQEDLRYDAGSFRLRFPMVVNKRYIPGGAVADTPPIRSSQASPFPGHGWATNTDQVPDASRITPPQVFTEDDEILNPVNLAVEIDAGLPLALVESMSHEVDITELPSPDGSSARVRYLVEPSAGVVPANRDFVLEWQPERGSEPKAALFTEEHDGETYALLMVMPPHEKAVGTRLPRETIFVLDKSGSMGGESIRQAKKALLLALERLAPEDHFNIIEFESSASRLFEESVPADASHLQIARRRVDAIEAGGGTEMMSALALALGGQDRDLGLRQVIFITDGSVGNEAALFAHIRQHLDRSRLFTVGIGSAPNSHFMNKAAEFGGGTFTFIGDLREVGSKMSELFSKIEHPVLRDIAVMWSDPVAESWPERPGDLYQGEPLVLAVRSPNGLGDVRLDGRLGDVPWEQQMAMSGGFQAAPGQSLGIHKLWARKKIASLEDQKVGGADPESIRQQIVELGLGHHLVTRHTSLVAVDRTPTRPVDENLHSAAVPVQTPKGWRPPGTLPQGGTASRISLLGGLLLLAMAWLSTLRFGGRS